MDSWKDDGTPLLAISIEAQTLLSTLLNPLKVIPTETNLPRDWRGVAELADVPYETIKLFEGRPDPFKELFNYLSGANFKLCIDDLKAFLGVIDRFDALEDASPILERDEQSYLIRIRDVQLDKSAETLDPKEDANVLTFEDAVRARRGLPLCRYDAFILYSEYSEADVQFADEIIHRLEGEYGLKICSKERDLLPGLKFEHEVIGKMIESRCNRLLVVFSPSFLESSANQFLVSYAQAVALDTRSRKIIPCVFKKCELPPSVRFSFCIDYNRSGKLWNFWDKLSQSLIVSRKSVSISDQTDPGANRKMDLVKHERTVSTDKECKQPDSLEWWDATKSSKMPDPKYADYPNREANGYVGGSSFEDQSDTMSIHSQAKLVPNQSSESKPSKWLSKIIRKKRNKTEKYKEQHVAE